ncbi:hypothetical protein CVU75_01205, partial [Candidatus Dependentiae bacterium HGW-Dependentiae-1]
MNLKDMVLPLGLAIVTVWGINYFFGGSRAGQEGQAAVSSGQTFVAPKERLELAPLNKEIDFVDREVQKVPVLTEIETTGALYQFSTEGASLDRMEFKRQRGDVLATIFPVSAAEREQRCFLVALAEKTPFHYTLVDHKKGDKTHELLYQAETEQAVVQKKFIVSVDTYKIDLELTIKPKQKELAVGITPRIFFPAPVVPDIAKYDVISAVYNNQKGAIEKTARASLNVQQGWFSPTLFGVEDRYFIHALVADPMGFA